MNNFFIITNKSKDLDGNITKEVIDYIEKSGKQVSGSISSLPDNDSSKYLDIAKSIPSDTDCIVVLGGDGTLLRGARHLYSLNIPFVGINLGHLGYLTEGNEDDIKNIFTKLFNGEYVIEDRMLLSSKHIGNNIKDDCHQIALNDITLTRNNSLKIINFNLYVNGALLHSYVADGIVISTPTGSTAYNLSLGGPIATPTSKLILVTPIAPHSLNNRSLILSCDDILELEVVDQDFSRDLEYLIFFDGDSSKRIYPGDRVKISKEEKVVKLIKLSSESFLETLKEKMQ